MKFKKLLLIFAIVCSFVSIANSSSQEVLKKYKCKIIKTDSLHTFKKSYEIQIPHQLTEEQLREIATQLIKENPQYVRIFIGYRLPNFLPNSIYWATSHYTPELKIEILGLTKDEEDSLKKVANVEGKIIGKWLDKVSYEHSIVIFEVEGEYRMRKTFTDGTSGDTNLKYSSSNGKTKFNYKNSYGEYLLIEKDGRLGYYDKEGLIYHCEKIE